MRATAVWACVRESIVWVGTLSLPGFVCLFFGVQALTWETNKTCTSLSLNSLVKVEKGWTILSTAQAFRTRFSPPISLYSC